MEEVEKEGDTFWRFSGFFFLLLGPVLFTRSTLRFFFFVVCDISIFGNLLRMVSLPCAKKTSDVPKLEVLALWLELSVTVETMLNGWVISLIVYLVYNQFNILFLFLLLSPSLRRFRHDLRSLWALNPLSPQGTKRKLEKERERKRRAFRSLRCVFHDYFPNTSFEFSAEIQPRKNSCASIDDVFNLVFNWLFHLVVHLVCQP